MFKRDKTPETAPAPSTHGSSAAPAEGAAVAEAGPRDRSQGKKGPTPRRRDQEAARRRTLVPEDRKAARKAERQAMAQELSLIHI